jgi:hypothetical protein
MVEMDKGVGRLVKVETDEDVGRSVEVDHGEGFPKLKPRRCGSS